jgi:hypothetical protein
MSLVQSQYRPPALNCAFGFGGPSFLGSPLCTQAAHSQPPQAGSLVPSVNVVVTNDSALIREAET